VPSGTLEGVDGDGEQVETTELFLDERGSLLRVRWDRDRELVELSIWRDGTCVATHRLGRADAERLASLLALARTPGGAGRSHASADRG
jgi:hypothetical protein